MPDTFAASAPSGAIYGAALCVRLFLNPTPLASMTARLACLALVLGLLLGASAQGRSMLGSATS